MEHTENLKNKTSGKGKRSRKGQKWSFMIPREKNSELKAAELC